jgi:hypothetical protein
LLPDAHPWFASIGHAEEGRSVLTVYWSDGGSIPIDGLCIISTGPSAQLGASSRLNAEGGFARMLRMEGRRAASQFLDAHADDLGKRATADLDVLLAEC